MNDQTDDSDTTGQSNAEGDCGYLDRALKSAIDNIVWVASRVIFAVALLLLTVHFEVDIKKLMTGNVISAIESHELQRFQEEYDKVDSLEVALSQIYIKAIELLRKSASYNTVSTNLSLLDISTFGNKISEAEKLFESRSGGYSEPLEEAISMFLETALRHHGALKVAHESGRADLSGKTINLLYSQSKQLEDLNEDISVFAPKYREQLKEEIGDE